MSFPIKVDKSRIYVGNRFAGTITNLNGEKVFLSYRNRAKHFFRNFKGWGLSREVFSYLKLNGVKQIHLRINLADTLTSNITDWEKHAIPYHKPPYEPQLILPEKFFKIQKLALPQLMEQAKR